MIVTTKGEAIALGLIFIFYDFLIFWVNIHFKKVFLNVVTKCSFRHEQEFLSDFLVEIPTSVVVIALVCYLDCFFLWSFSFLKFAFCSMFSHCPNDNCSDGDLWSWNVCQVKASHNGKRSLSQKMGLRPKGNSYIWFHIGIKLYYLLVTNLTYF